MQRFAETNVSFDFSKLSFAGVAAGAFKTHKCVFVCFFPECVFLVCFSVFFWPKGVFFSPKSGFYVKIGVFFDIWLILWDFYYLGRGSGAKFSLSDPTVAWVLH